MVIVMVVCQPPLHNHRRNQVQMKLDTNSLAHTKWECKYHKGDSIGVQFKQCADYAKKEVGLDEEYEFLQYEDKGLSG